jgi:uncharacterized protein YndB with AHSA1/START domain
MGSRNILPQPGHLARNWNVPLPVEPLSTVSIVRSIHADRQRLFQALTMAEYVEAWFSPPGSPGGSTSVTMNPNSFSITYRAANTHQHRILCQYKVMRRSKIHFTWKRDSFEDTATSMVRIRLQGDFEKSIVHLSHFGLHSVDQRWHQSLWEKSLDMLARLF